MQKCFLTILQKFMKNQMGHFLNSIIAAARADCEGDITKI